MEYVRGAAFAAAVAATIGLVSASSHAEPVSVVVNFADLDLATLAGETALRKRVSGAVFTACGKRPSAEAAMELVRRACIRNTAVTAEAHVDAVISGSRSLAHADPMLPGTAH
ncbi:UrcA family protein [Sphingosinicella soli]|uniref:UrcA family protein n=1 Tax=Sphingosinicella soli TaxID=333708 RepID=A0A7W7F9Q0_9SPHN|nr:UrcA family protein [Sphingosinicella soli]MBB4632873.1 UrcA family protein [Sphingosinicella soli]